MHAFVRKTTFMPQSWQRAALVDADNGYVASTARLPGSAGHVSPPAPRGFGIAGPPFSLRLQAALGRPSFWAGLRSSSAAPLRPFQRTSVERAWSWYSGFGRISPAEAMRFDMLKKLAT